MRVAITVKGVEYHVPKEVLDLALTTFDQQYPTWRGRVPALARRIAADLMPSSDEDPFSSERLARCILSVKGRRGGRKGGTRRIESIKQLELPF